MRAAAEEEVAEALHPVVGNGIVVTASVREIMDTLKAAGMSIIIVPVPRSVKRETSDGSAKAEG